MSITTYSELQTAIASWLGHGLFTANIPDFIDLFESVANRRLRTRFQETTSTVTMTGGSGALPADFLQQRRVTWAGSTKVELDYVEPSYIQSAYPTDAAGTPQVYTIEGSTIYVRPSSDTNLTLVYYAKIPALSDSATTNWLLTSHPDLYLFGSMVEAENFGVNDDRMPMWKARRDEIFEELIQLSNKSRVGTGAGIRVMGSTP
jgi:hypothetical protein